MSTEKHHQLSSAENTLDGTDLKIALKVGRKNLADILQKITSAEVI